MKNIKKGVVCQEKKQITTNQNQAYFAKLGTPGLQEGVLRKGGLRTSPTYLQYHLTLDIKDYHLKCANKRGRAIYLIGFSLSPQLFFPVGIKKTRGIVNKSPSPKERKTVLKP